MKYTMRITSDGPPYTVSRGYHGVGIVRKHEDGRWSATINGVEYPRYADPKTAFEEAAARASGYESFEAMRSSKTATREQRRKAKRDAKKFR